MSFYDLADDPTFFAVFPELEYWWSVYVAQGLRQLGEMLAAS